MRDIQVKLTITFGESAARAIADLLAPAFKQANIASDEGEERQEARLRASQNAIFAGAKPPDNQGRLVGSKEVAKMLGVSERTLWKMHTTGEMPPPIRIGRAVRFSVDALKKWVEAGCPTSQK